VCGKDMFLIRSEGEVC